MKTVWKLATLTLMMFAVSLYGFSQGAGNKTPATATQNLVRGVTGPVGSNSNWSDYTLMGLVPGSALFPITSSTTVFYYGFTAGSEADIGNMVVYTTARGSLTITAVTPVTLGGVSNPSIMLSSTSVCPVAPSTTTPCIVRFDPTTLTLSPSNDYYFTVFFIQDANNQSIAAAEPGSNLQTSIAGTYFGENDTTFSVGQVLPSAANSVPNFLMYVMTN